MKEYSVIIKGDRISSGCVIVKAIDEHSAANFITDNFSDDVEVLTVTEYRKL